VTQPLLEIRTGHWAPTGIIRYEGDASRPCVGSTCCA
jgi:hypothetical protein